MKPVPFAYKRAGSVFEACKLLAADPESMVIAGGQTLMPMLAMRLARPTRLVDISRIPGLSGITREADAVVIGATTRQCEVERNPLVAAELPLLARAMPWVGHAPTRRRGTVGGSLANADPAAEIALVAVTLQAEFVIADASGGLRRMPAAEFFLGPMITSLRTGEILTSVRFPRHTDRGNTGVGFCEMSNRRSDYALAAAAVALVMDGAGRCRTLLVGIGGAAEIPSRLDLSALHGRALAMPETESALTDAVARLPLLQDPHTSASYRGRIAVALAMRAIAQAQAALSDQPKNRSTQAWN
jgi:carbon-monoxide dehydrogenase medium subunit